MESRAVGKYLGLSPRKSSLQRGPDPREAGGRRGQHIVIHAQGGAKAVSKVLQSALANARQNPSIDVDTLVVKTIFVNQGRRRSATSPSPWAGRAHSKAVLSRDGGLSEV